MVLILAFLFYINYKLGIAFLISWWFGLCDLLYYLISLENFMKYRMYWLWWTVYGMHYAILGKAEKITAWHLIIGSIIGLFFSIYIIGWL